ncbi:MAG TPA: hypothetical protein VK302_01310, partial [Terriglobales bacterium]|nr:hypothetical protein [Terriglobales bacterium]
FWKGTSAWKSAAQRWTAGSSKSELLIPIGAAMRRELISGSYIQADETPVDVQTREGEVRTTKRTSGNTVAPEKAWCSTSV